jgi:hypothetical protein
MFVKKSNCCDRRETSLKNVVHLCYKRLREKLQAFFPFSLKQNSQKRFSPKLDVRLPALVEKTRRPNGKFFQLFVKYLKTRKNQVGFRRIENNQL